MHRGLYERYKRGSSSKPKQPFSSICSAAACQAPDIVPGSMKGMFDSCGHNHDSEIAPVGRSGSLRAMAAEDFQLSVRLPDMYNHGRVCRCNGCTRREQCAGQHSICWTPRLRTLADSAHWLIDAKARAVPAQLLPATCSIPSESHRQQLANTAAS